MREWLSRLRRQVRMMLGSDVRPWSHAPQTYVVRMRRYDDHDAEEVAFVWARWVKADDDQVWWCSRCRSIRCQDVDAVESYRTSAGLPRSPAERDPDDR